MRPLEQLAEELKELRSAVDSQLEVGRQVHTKFAFYSVALTFTILGLAIQTASFGANVVADSAELLAWAILLLSGFNGLFLLEKVVTLLGLHVRKQFAQDVKKVIIEEDSRASTAYRRHRSAFVWGVVLLVVSRGLVPALDLFGRIWAIRS